MDTPWVHGRFWSCSIPACSLFFEILGLGALCGAGCGGHPKTISHHLSPVPNSSFLSGPELLAFGCLMKMLKETHARFCSIPACSHFWDTLGLGGHWVLPMVPPGQCVEDIPKSRLRHLFPAPNPSFPAGGGGDPWNVLKLLHPCLLPAPVFGDLGWGSAGCCLWCRGHPKTISPSPLPCFKSTFSNQAWAFGLWVPHGRAAGDPELLSPKSAPALGSQL